MCWRGWVGRRLTLIARSMRGDLLSRSSTLCCSHEVLVSRCSSSAPPPSSPFHSCVAGEAGPPAYIVLQNVNYTHPNASSAIVSGLEAI